MSRYIYRRLTMYEVNQEWLNDLLDKTMTKVAKVSERSAKKIPYTTVDGVHDDKAYFDKDNLWDGLSFWTNGFWPGMMWQMYHATGEERYAEIARFTEVGLDKTFDSFYGLHHDVGFMWLPTAVANYRLTKDEDAKRRSLHAATLLAGRFNPVGKFIRAWNDFPGRDNRGWAIIDCMFNIPLLYWASEETGDPRYGQIAKMHATTVMHNFIRDNGSSEHIVEFNPFTGEKVKIYGGQGYADGSAWTRGQTWALYGFVMSYKHTQEEAFLDTAKKVSDYFISQTPESGLIPIDFDQPAEPAYEDSTAAAIAACGLIELAKILGDGEGDKYLEAAVRMLKAQGDLRADWSEETDGILTHCSARYHEENPHYSIIYGDYYFLEALLKLKGKDLYIW